MTIDRGSIGLLVGVTDMGFGRIHDLSPDPLAVVVRLGSTKLLRTVPQSQVWAANELNLYKELRHDSEMHPDGTDIAFIEALWPNGFLRGDAG